MDESQAREILAEAVLEFIDKPEGDCPVVVVVNFEDTGLMTENTGFILRCHAAKFQVTIIRSR